MIDPINKFVIVIMACFFVILFLFSEERLVPEPLLGTSVVPTPLSRSSAVLFALGVTPQLAAAFVMFMLIAVV